MLKEAIDNIRNRVSNLGKVGSYFIGASVAVIIAIIVYSFVPTLYASRAEVSDETEDLELLIGKNSLSELLKADNLFSVNFYDAVIYSQAMSSLSFKKEILGTYLPEFKTDYAHYLADNENAAIKEFDNLVSYYYSPKFGTITIQVKDKNPIVAANLVDTIVNHLDIFVNKRRVENLQKSIEVSNALLNEADSAYRQAAATYADYCDRHRNAKEEHLRNKMQELSNNVDLAKADYNNKLTLYKRIELQSQLHQNTFSVIYGPSVPTKKFSPHLFLYIISFVIIFVVLYSWYLLGKGKKYYKEEKLLDLFSPWMLTICIWAGSLFLFSIQKDLLYPLSVQFYYCLVLWVPIFCLSSFITFYVLPAKKEPFAESKDFSIILFNILFAVVLIITPLYVYKILSIVMQFDTTDMLYNIRALSMYGDERHGLLSYAYVLNQALFIIAIVQYPKVKGWQIGLLFITNILSCFSIMEKNGIFLIVVVSLFILYEKKYIKARTILLTFVVVVIGFFFFNMSKEIQSDDSAERMSFVDYLGVYLLSPSVAFGYVNETLTDQVGANTFPIFYMILNKVGLGNFEVYARMQDFVWVPVPTNVYTIFQPFFKDFGYSGIAFFALVYGILSGLFYRLFINGNTFGTCIYAYLTEVLIMQFYHESLLQNFILVVQISLIVFVITQNKVKFTR